MERKRKHSSCSLREKLEVLHRIDNGESATKLAQEFCVGRATISDWKKNRYKLERFCNTTSIETLERRHTSKISPFDKVDEALYIWFMEEREKGTYLTGPLLQEKALQFNKLLQGENNFVASNGWLDRWKKRHGIRMFSLPGDCEFSSADRAYKNNWSDRSKLITGYLPSGIDTVEHGTNFEQFSQQKSCTPDFKLSRDYLNALSNGAHSLTFPTRTRRAKKTSQACENLRETDVLRERFKKELAAAVKRYSVPVSKKTGTLDSETKCEDEFVDVPEEILHLVKEIPSHCDQEEDLSEWVTMNISDNLESSEETDIVAQNGEREEEEGDAGAGSEARISNIAAARALEIALKYVRQHVDATQTDVMLIERWRNIATSTLLNELRLKKFD